MSSFIHAKNHMTLEVLCFSLFVLNIGAQLWNYDYVEQVTEDIPLWKAVRETEKSGFWDLGSGRSVKAVVFQLGGCSKGHPCGSGSGIPWFWPEGCDPVLCYRRFIGDTWRQYSFNCDNYINSSNVEWAEETFENQTKLSAEWFEYHEPSCLVRRNETTQQWTHDKSGVAIVLRAHGFTFPSQTVLVSDIDSVFDSDLWPDVPQEAVTNFAMLNGDFLKPSNTYALDHYDQLDLAFSPPILTEINITLSQTYLDALELGLTSDWVWGSISALAQNLVDNFPEDSMPKHWDVSAGGTVWAKIESEFDTWHSSVTLGRKDLHDQDHGVNISPLKAKKRCRCSLIIKNMRVLRRTETENECSSTLVENLEYNCDEAGEFYCNEVRVTGWFIADDNNANSGSAFPCEPRNITKMIYETDVSSIGTVDWSAWPLVIPANPFPVFNP